jgi:hypothetical protein
MSLEILPVSSQRDLETFLRVPALLRPHQSFAMPPSPWLYPLLDRRRNPYFRHADHVLMVARRDGRYVGRIGVFLDHLCNRTLGEQQGSFSLFDCINSPRVAALILEAAEHWLRQREVTVVRGPLGPAMRLGTGLLVEGHGEPPMPGMTFDAPELAPLIEGAGYQTQRDLYAFKMATHGLPLSISAAADDARRRSGLSVRNFRAQLFEKELGGVREVINELPGFGRACAPWTEAEISWLTKQIWPILDPFLALIVEQRGVPIGVGMALRNVRELFGGRTPQSSARDLWRVVHALSLRRVRSARIALLSVRPHYDRALTGAGDLAALVLVELLGRLSLLGVHWAEVSLVDATDDHLCRLLAEAGASITKTYRVYEKILNASR